MLRWGRKKDGVCRDQKEVWSLFLRIEEGSPVRKFDIDEFEMDSMEQNKCFFGEGAVNGAEK